MKKLVPITLAAALILGGSMAVKHGFAQNDDQQKVEAKQTEEAIGIEKAKAAALKQVNGTVESVELESKNSQTYYEVDIDKDKKDYDIYVDAYTAEILKVEENNFDDDDRDDQVSATTVEGLLSKQEAMAIATKQVTGEVVKIELDEDDSRYEYEMELKTDKGEADITIDAKTGKVLELELDDHDDDERYDD
ncbi:MAG TPA: PepSY domain-containing protein [Bacillus sp. (in: firmicutes)]|nr:PepSY domain-containing protein [Bacillus sp. (in: firmicutes)]